MDGAWASVLGVGPESDSDSPPAAWAHVLAGGSSEDEVVAASSGAPTPGSREGGAATPGAPLDEAGQDAGAGGVVGAPQFASQLGEEQIRDLGISRPSLPARGRRKQLRHRQELRLFRPVIECLEPHPAAGELVADFPSPAPSRIGDADVMPHPGEDELGLQGVLALRPDGPRDVVVYVGPQLQPLYSKYDNLALAVERAAFLIKCLDESDRIPEHLRCNRMIKAAMHLLFSKNSMLAESHEASTLGVSRKTLGKARFLSAMSSLVMVGRDAMKMVKACTDEVVRTGGRAVCLTEFYRADETPLRFVVSEGGEKDAVDGPFTFELPTRDVAVTKVLQAERAYSAFYVRSDGSGLSITFELPLPLAVMSSTKSEVYYVAHKATQLPMDDILPKFERHQLLTVTDADSAVLKATRGYFKDRPGAHAWHHACEIHHMANITKLVMRPAMVDRHISCSISTALCLKPANAMKVFRECMGQALAERFCFIRAHPPPQHKYRREQALSLCLPGESRAAVTKRFVIGVMLNGDWSLHDRVEHYCTGCCRDAAQSLKRMRAALGFSMASSSPTIWPRSRWRGAIPATNWLLLMIAAHNLFRATFVLWAKQQRGGEKLVLETERAAQDWLLPRVAGLLAIRDEPDVHVDAADPLPGNAQPDANPAVYDPAAGGAPGADAWQERQREQSQYLRTAVRWLMLDDPEGILLLIRFILGPLDDMLTAFFTQAGENFNTKESARFVQAAQANAERKRDYRVHMTSVRKALGDGLSRYASLMAEESSWSLLPDRFRTTSFSARASCMISQAAALLYKVKLRLLAPPFRLFNLLVDDSDAEAIQQMPSCMLDSWSSSFVSHYCSKPGGLVRSDCKLDLEHTANVMMFETASIEAGHASIRRIQKLKSTQTHNEHIMDASAEWLLRRMRKLCAPLRARPGSSGRAPDLGGGQGGNDPSRKRGCGGAWRAHVRKELLGKEGRGSFRDCKVSYAALTQEEKAALEEEGRAATLRAKAKEHPSSRASAFGLTKRERMRQNRRLAFEQEVQDLARQDALGRGGDADSPSKRRRLCIAAAPFEENRQPSTCSIFAVVPPLAEVSRQCLVSRKAALHKESFETEILERYEGGAGKEVIDRIVADVSCLRCRRQEFQARPTAQLSSLQWRPSGVRERVLRSMRLDSRREASLRVAPALQEGWAELHRSIQSQPEVRKQLEGVPIQRRPCYDAGRCLCDAPGRRLRDFLRSLDKVMRPLFKPHTDARAELTQGEVFILFAMHSADDAREGGAGDSAVLVVGDPSSQLIGHVAYQELSPWDNMWEDVAMEKSPFDEGGGLLERCDVVLTGAYKSRADFFGRFDLSRKWSFGLYKAAFTGEMLGSFVPARQALKRFGGDAAGLRMFWDPFNRRARGRGRRCGGWAAMLALAAQDDALEDEEEDASEDGRPPASEASEVAEESEQEGQGAYEDCQEVPGEFMGMEGEDEEGHAGLDAQALQEFGITWDDLRDTSDGEAGRPEAGIAGDGVAEGDAAEGSSSSSESDSPSSSSSPSGSPSGSGSTEGDGRQRHLTIPVGHWATATLYLSGERRDLIMRCTRPLHGVCRFTRTLNGAERRGREGQGRPIGLCIAWALNCTDADHPTRVIHQAWRPSLQARQEARAVFAGMRRTKLFFQAERPQRPGEPPEPELIP